MKHIHHKVPRSRGGTDDLSNLEEIDYVEHAKLHAEDFLNGGPRFDFRHKGWPLLEENLRKKVLEKASEHSRTVSGPAGGKALTFEQLSAAGKKGGPIGAKNQPREVRVANARKGVQTRIEKYGSPFKNQYDLNTQFRCPCCGYTGNAGNVTKHLNSKSNDCVGTKQTL
jgi:5-methylcytosine-specific restriction endonuclease McrA